MFLRQFVVAYLLGVVHVIAPLCGIDDFITHVLEDLADKLFAPALAVHICHFIEIDAKVVCLFQHLYCLVVANFLAPPVKSNGPGSKAYLAYLDVALAKPSVFHANTSITSDSIFANARSSSACLPAASMSSGIQDLHPAHSCLVSTRIGLGRLYTRTSITLIGFLGL